MNEYLVNPLESDADHLKPLKLNAVIGGMENLPKHGLTAADIAYDMALVEKPYMDKAVGHLALAAQRHHDYHRDVNGPNFMPAVAPFQLIREGRQIKKAEREITKAYKASSVFNR